MVGGLVVGGLVEGSLVEGSLVVGGWWLVVWWCPFVLWLQGLASTWYRRFLTEDKRDVYG